MQSLPNVFTCQFSHIVTILICNHVKNVSLTESNLPRILTQRLLILNSIVKCINLLKLSPSSVETCPILEFFISWLYVSGIVFWWTLHDRNTANRPLFSFYGPQHAPSPIRYIPSTPTFPNSVRSRDLKSVLDQINFYLLLSSQRITLCWIFQE